MKFENSFDVSLPPAEAWRVLMDVERVAPCMPGAELTEVVDDRTFRGKVSVRLGPVSLTFAGEATVEAIDEAARTARVRAQGRDPKGRGGASALVDFRLTESPTGSTVLVETDLTLSGSVAQYGRGAGMIKSVAGQLIDHFAKNLEAQLGKGEKPRQPPPCAEASKTGPAAAPAPAASAVSALSLFWRAFVDWVRGKPGGRGSRS